MGQAKRRGTFEERKCKAIVRDEANRIRRVEAERQRRANMTPEEKRIEHKNKVMFSSYLGFALSGGYIPYKI